jgi:hypothetical protein
VTSASSWPKSWHVLEPPSSAELAVLLPGLAAGDVLLSCPIAPTAVQHGVQKLQARWYAASHARFTHVGIYIGSGWVVDATPQAGVCARRLERFRNGCEIRARRVKEISRDQQQATVALATRWAGLNQPYSYVQAVAAALAAEARPSPKSRWAKTIQKLVAAESDGRVSSGGLNGVYCGSLVDSILGAITNRSIVDDLTCFAPTPAAFSANLTELENVRLRS